MPDMEGNIDMPYGENYGGTENVDSSVSSLFKEIGNTLVDVTKQGISGAVSTVKTTLANKIMNSTEGQAQISQYKMQTFLKYLPWLLIGGIALLIGRRYLKA